MFRRRAASLPGAILNNKARFWAWFSSLPLPARIVVIQLVIAGVTAALLLPMGKAHALAAVGAGVAVVAPNAWFAWRLQRSPWGADTLDASSQARVTLLQTAQKLMATVLLILGVLAWLRPNPVAFIGTIVVLHGAFYLAVLLGGDGSEQSEKRGAPEMSEGPG